MSDESRYAYGHDAKHSIPVRHHIYRLPEAHGNAELHLTSDGDTHYIFSFTRQQVWSAVRQLTEILSRMSDTKRSA